MTALNASVLIPAFNAAGTIRRAVDSALAQDLDGVEVVVCDDGSTDATAEVLAAYGDRIVVVQQANGGLAAARNAALRASTGQVVALLDADDEWRPDRLTKLVAALDADPAAVVATSDADVVTPGQPTRGWYGDHVDWVDGADQRVEILRENFVFGGAAIRRDALDSIGGFDSSLPHGSEYEAWVRLMFRGGLAVLVPERLATYHRSDQSLSVEDRRGTYRMVLAVLDRTRREEELDGAQRAALEDQWARKHRWLDVLDALHVLAGEDDRARARLRAAATSPYVSKHKRALFRAACAAPGLARLAYARLPERARPAGWPAPQPGSRR